MIEPLRSERAEFQSEEESPSRDERLSGIFDLLSLAPLGSLETFLDIGCGDGRIATWLRGMGKRVTATTLCPDSYGGAARELASTLGMRVEECSAEAMPFRDGEFDAVVMCHVLEHCPNVQAALREAWRVLAADGYLFVFVPPHSDRVAAGHISVGWNIGQLMYALLVNGFDVKGGSFVEADHSVAAFVRKSPRPIPPLSGDCGDIRALNEMGLFPARIATPDGANDSFHGKLKCVNWPHYRAEAPPTGLKPSLKKCLKRAARVIPPAAREWIRGRLASADGILKDDPPPEERIELVNPSVLR